MTLEQRYLLPNRGEIVLDETFYFWRAKTHTLKRECPALIMKQDERSEKNKEVTGRRED